MNPKYAPLYSFSSLYIRVLERNTSRIVLMLLMMLLTTSPAYSEILHESNFDEEIHADWKSSGNSPIMTDDPGDPVCNGTGLEVSLDYNNDSVSYRTELSLGGGMDEFILGKEYWVGFSVYLPESWKSDTSPGSADIFLQFHRVPDSNIGEVYGGGPNLSLFTLGEDIYLKNAWDPNKLTTKIDGSSQVQSNTRTLGKWKTGEWMRFVIRVKFSYNPDGTIEVWKNGNKVFSSINNIGNAYNDDQGPYLKTGIYKSSWRKNITWGTGVVGSGFSSRLLYLDEIRIADEHTDADGNPPIDQVQPQCDGSSASAPAPTSASAPAPTSASAPAPTFVPSTPTGIQLNISPAN